MLIIPAIDIYNNKTVRLLKGNFDEVTYYPLSPFDQAKLFENFGFKRIHIVDLLGSANGQVNILDTLKKIKSETSLQIEFGGGIREEQIISQLLQTGIEKIIIGSLAIKNKKLFEKLVDTYKPESFIVAADVKNEMISIQGWKDNTSITLDEHLKYCNNLGLDEFIITDISKDGTLEGPNLTLYEDIMNKFPAINIIASGGIKDINDIASLQRMNMYAAVTGKAIYEKKIDLKELKSFAD